MPRRAALVVIALITLLAAPVSAQQPSGVATGRPLRVGVMARPPFAIRTSDGAWLGMGVDLWRLMAEDLDLRYHYVEVKPDEAVADLTSGRIDVLLPIDATSKLEQVADPTLPFYTATLGVAAERPSRMLSVARSFLSWQLLRIVGAVSGLLLIVGAIVWAIERRHNDSQFHRAPLKGLGDGFWWAGVTLTTIGYGDKAPVTVAGRAVAMLWMLIGLAVSSALTAAVVTLAGATHPVDVPQVFSGETVGTIEGSSAALLLTREGVDVRTFGSITEALRAMQSDQVGAVAAAAPALAYVVNHDGAVDVQVRNTQLDPHYVSFAVREGSPLRESLDGALLRRLLSESGLNLINRYLPDQLTQ